MKKIIGIVIASLVFCNIGFAEVEEMFTVAIADKVIESFEKLIAALLAPGAYTAMGPIVNAAGLRAALRLIKTDLDDISSELVKIEK